MLRVVLPVISSLASIDIIVLVVIVVVVDVDVAVAPAAAPTPAAAPSGAQSKSGPERQAHSGDITRIGIWIIGIGGRSVDDHWIVRRNIDDFGIGLLNNDNLLAAFYRFSLHFLFRVGF
jgi:hypothetical protein